VALVNAVAHTGITVRVLEASISFWRDVLGFDVQHRFELSGDFAEQITGVADAHIPVAVLARGEHRLELLEYLRPADRAHVCPRPCDVGPFHLAVNVDDLDVVAETCAQHGWERAGEPQTGVEGPLAGPIMLLGLRTVIRSRSIPECHLSSVNDVVLHSILRDYVLRDGDVLNLDFAVSIEGWVADSAVTVIVGDTEFDEHANDGHVGSRMLSQNARFRVWEIRLAPGKRWHAYRHVLDYFWTAVTPGRSRQHTFDGTTREVTYLTGQTRHFHFGPGEYLRHDIENIGDADLVFTTAEHLAGANPPLPVGADSGTRDPRPTARRH
jgi:beta-alanine degradation protein BauB